MKICCFHPALAPYRVDFFNAFAERYDLHLILLGRNVQEQQFDQKALLGELRCRVSYLLSGFVFRQRYLRFGVLRLVHKEHPDAVISYEFSLITVVLILGRLFLRMRYKLYTMTDDNAELFAKCNGLRRMVRNFALRYLDGCFIVDERVKAQMAAISGSSDFDVVTVPIVYDERRFRRDADRIFQRAVSWRGENLVLGEKSVFFVGRLEEVKNLQWLIRCAASYKWPSRCKLFLVGDGSQRCSLDNLIQRLSLEQRVHLLGRKEGDALHVLFAAADVVVLCSHQETFGAVVAEGLQWGCTALVSESVGAKTLIRPGVNGGVFPSNDEDVFLKELARLVEYQKPWAANRPSLSPVRLDEALTKFKL